MIRERELFADSTKANKEEAEELKWWILDFVDRKAPISADDIYRESGCGDSAMYLALHELVKCKLISGPSPYDALHVTIMDEMDNGKEVCKDVDMHISWEYNIGPVMADAQIGELAKRWDPAKWDYAQEGGAQ